VQCNRSKIGCSMGYKCIGASDISQPEPEPEPEPRTAVFGCTTSAAVNYDSSATVDDGSCVGVLSCADQPCQNGGTCTPSDGPGDRYTCKCQHVFGLPVHFGKNCEFDEDDCHTFSGGPNPCTNITAPGYDVTKMVCVQCNRSKIGCSMGYTCTASYASAVRRAQSIHHNVAPAAAERLADASGTYPDAEPQPHQLESQLHEAHLRERDMREAYEQTIAKLRQEIARLTAVNQSHADASQPHAMIGRGK
jgi:hypothetical protein